MFDGADVHLDHRPRDRHRPLDARPVRVVVLVHQRHRSGRASSWASRRSSRRTCCSTSRSCCCSCGRGCRAWTGRMVEASYDLYASPWRTFRQITFPQLLPAIVAGFLLAFTFSFDDYVITSFVSGPGSSTLPIFIFGQVKTGVTPGDQRGRDDDAGVHAADARGGPVRPDPQLAPLRRRPGRRDGRDDRGDEQLVVSGSKARHAAPPSVACDATMPGGPVSEAVPEPVFVGPWRHDAGRAAVEAGPDRCSWPVTPDAGLAVVEAGPGPAVRGP